MNPTYPTPNIRHLLPPLLASLPAATASPQPPIALLPCLSPILRQRVKLLSADEPWIGLLCYDSQMASKLNHVVQSDAFEPHPASGEVEVDWDEDVKIQYRRVDEETLQALVSLMELCLNVKLIWCVGDPEGGDGWKIGEVGAIDSAQDTNWGIDTIREAEERFESQTSHAQTRVTNGAFGSSGSWQHVDAPEEDEDDDYWAQYDQTPARTPGPHQTPPPQFNTRDTAPPMSAEDAYYAQYSAVQPAMDGYDPDEAAQNGDVETTLGKADIATELRQEMSSHPEFTQAEDAPYISPPPLGFGQPSARDRDDVAQRDLIQPRPGSSHSSSGSATVAHLERTAAAHDTQHQSQGEMAVKQHIGYTIKSLFRLSKAAGIDRSEFERLVSMELELLSVGEEHD